jgi:hypothetical protein
VCCPVAHHPAKTSVNTRRCSTPLALVQLPGFEPGAGDSYRSTRVAPGMGGHPQARTRGSGVRTRIGPPPLTDSPYEFKRYSPAWGPHVARDAGCPTPVGRSDFPPLSLRPTPRRAGRSATGGDGG